MHRTCVHVGCLQGRGFKSAYLEKHADVAIAGCSVSYILLLAARPML